ncbi:DUF2496 domain-containing protein [Pseudoalteromonas sp. A25]|uniref:YbaM family protein n=1 Tax=Pseudoalteromonas sp. A25 TaxID=116092 RepID=UPI0012609D97|nr:YbaM family protein [Pseudoalteromonas sp. A25]BBN80892.1 DUF2496 domain-containing protein [Pseudoalteromonas sp. A25]
MSNSLEKAPQHVKLAVDLILLLEQNNVSAEDVLAALEIVKSDFEQKVTSKKQDQNIKN